MCPDDAQLAAFLEGALGPDEVAALSEHLSECASCRRLVAAGSSVVSTANPLDRYVLLHEVGAGAMGVVFAAWDNNLDRRVALKMLHPGAEEGREERLAKEARSLARLSHPNVVAVYDVGRSGDGVHVAMEFVDGQTLRQWLNEPRAEREILEVFREAGAGLLAAHEAGLVHRDFKPDNVLIGRDGRVRVSDFGLARVGAVRAGPAVDVGTSSLTRTGMAVGTPAYMSPEALRGDVVDARSDQFSFCVSLWEALAGARPFTGASSEELRTRIESASFEPGKTAVSRGLEQVLRRGLSADPARRFASLNELLAALEPPSARWWPVAVAAAVVLLGVFGVALVRAQRDVCEGSQAALAAVWSDSQRAKVSEVLRAGGAEASQVAVERALQEWGTGWTRARTEACRATQRKEQSEGLLDQRMQCFDGQLRETEALVAELMKADRTFAERALEAVSSLPPPEACAPERVAQRVPVPKDRAAIEPLVAELARLRAVSLAGRFKEARDGAEQLVTKVRAVHHTPLLASTLLFFGTVLERTTEFEASHRVLVEAVSVAETARDDEVAVGALAQLSYVTGVRQSQFAAGQAWIEVGRGALTRLGGSARLEAELEGSQSILLRDSGKLDEALRHEETRATLLEALGPSAALAVSQSMVRRGRLLSDLGRYDDARRMLEDAVTRQEALLGPMHPELAATLNPLSMACRRGGQLDCAAHAGERALAIGTKTLGESSLEVGYTLNHLGNVYAVRGEWAKALATFQRVLGIGEKHLGTEHHEVGMAHANLCWSLRWLRRIDEAEVECARAKVLVVPKLGEQHGYTSEVLHQMAVLKRLRGLAKEALALEERALAGAEAVLGPNHPQLADPLTGLGLAELALGKKREAAVALERAISLMGNTSTKAELGEATLGLAVATGSCAKMVEGLRLLDEGGASSAEKDLAVALRAKCP